MAGSAKSAQSPQSEAQEILGLTLRESWKTSFTAKIACGHSGQRSSSVCAGGLENIVRCAVEVVVLIGAQKGLGGFKYQQFHGKDDV